ncbi:MAG: hypothetical protein A3K10_09235 [Bacteroidetes bacterium RIFCSPLOWO2_12_FULL_31_6]|nr:MAG: hypothetical protein A3K10_09235 [Bacteroidetes bacterium RIFCSPLOWO2_12_FULL_31_6]
MLDFKTQLYKHCVDYVNARINHIQVAMQAAQESINGETKSSAGDKHETSRAMAQLEQEKLSAQLAEAHKLQGVLIGVNQNEYAAKAELGSLVITSNGNYYICISAGKLVIDGETYFAVSIGSPIGKALLNARELDRILFNNQSLLIKTVA